jgi:uncharacterized membrane protein YphA (DoxX/SURF4 family)
VRFSPSLHTGAFFELQGKRGGVHLQRLFSAFPGGWPGVGLFLLRAAIGLVAVIQGVFYLSTDARSTLGVWLGLLGLAVGTALLAGFLTPVAGVVVALEALGAALSVLPVPAPNLLDAKLSLIFAAIITVAIVFLGPGAFSMDARLFGRREIIIPPSTRRPER